MPSHRNTNHINALIRFEEQFRPEIKEKLFLVKRRMKGGIKQGPYLLAGTRCIAWAECDTDELHNGSGGLRRMYRPSLFTGTSFFEDLGIYRVRVRENKTNPTDHMIVKILGKARDPRLEAIRTEYREPVVLDTEFGPFELDRNYDEYRGTVPYCGEEISVSLNVKEGQTDAELPLQRLREILADPAGFDSAVRTYIAADQTLWDWLDDSETDREGFEYRLGSPSIVIDANGETEVWLDGGDPFGGHSIVVYTDRNGTCTDIDLMG